jgi:uridine phosphorylase
MSDTSRVLHPKAEDGTSCFLHLPEDSMPGYAIVPGSPERIGKIVKNWENVRDVAANRHYISKRGVYKGMEQGACSTGIGALSAEICFNELRKAGVHTCLRVGSTGCLDGDYDIADLIIPVACIRKDGSSECYIEPEYPAFADPLMVMALAEACEKLGFRYGLGLEYTAGSFYMGQGRPLNDDGGGYLPSWVPNIIPDIEQMRVKVLEMDTSGQFVIGYLQGLRMGAVLTVVANRVHNTFGYKDGEEKACLAAAEALRILAGWDREGIQ